MHLPSLPYLLSLSLSLSLFFFFLVFLFLTKYGKLVPKTPQREKESIISNRPILAMHYALLLKEALHAGNELILSNTISGDQGVSITLCEVYISKRV